MSDSRIGRTGQIKVYVGKCFRTFFNEKGWKTLISTLIIAIILSWVVGDNTFVLRESTKNGFFAMICGCLWIGLFNSIQSICRERAIIKREHRTGLHISSYIIAHMIFESILSICEGIIMTAVFGLFRGFHGSGALFPLIGIDIFISFTLVIFASDALGILISCIVKSEKAAMTVMPFVLIVQLVMSGMIFALPSSADFIKELTVSKWGMNALCSASDTNSMESVSANIRIYQNNQELMDDYMSGDISGSDLYAFENLLDDMLSGSEIDMEDAEDLGLDMTGYIDEEYRHTPGCVLAAWGMLALYSLLYGFIGVLFLKTVDRDKR